MRWLDRAYVALWPRRRCFAGGWGEPEVLRSALDGSWADIEPAPLDLRWSRETTEREIRVRDGEIHHDTPDLPVEARRGRVRLLLPRRGPVRGLAVTLSSWGDELYETRTRIFGPAVPSGLAVMMLENPLYGSRRRAGQRDTRLRWVSDFVTMGRATIGEAIGLMNWGRSEGFGKIGVAGFSMGGQMAAMAGALASNLSPDPIRVACLAPSLTPASVFIEGPLSGDVAWDRLGPNPEPRLYPVLEALSVLALPKIADPSLVRLVGTRGDLFVRPGDADAIARYWGAHPRWINDGHVSAIALRAHALTQALLDAFAADPDPKVLAPTPAKSPRPAELSLR